MASSATDSQGKDKEIRYQLVQTGHVDVIISVANNFFYTKSLPCSLWFFNKAKGDDVKEKILFIDARNYFTVVDRTLNEWTEWQIKNLTAIVWLYRDERDKYRRLVDEYHAVLGADEFSVTVSKLEEQIAELRQEAKKEVETATKRERKKIQAVWDEKIAAKEDLLTIAQEAEWLCGKFGDGEYADVPGLCKAAHIDDIEEKGWSLTPGAYVGIAPTEDDGVDFKERMQEIHAELSKLHRESNDLMATIEANFRELGL